MNSKKKMSSAGWTRNKKMYNKKSKFGGRKKFEYSRLNSTFVKKVSSAGCTQNSWKNWVSTGWTHKNRRKMGDQPAEPKFLKNEAWKRHECRIHASQKHEDPGRGKTTWALLRHHRLIFTTINLIQNSGLGYIYLQDIRKSRGSIASPPPLRAPKPRMEEKGTEANKTLFFF